jgi:hypothetical protein
MEVIVEIAGIAAATMNEHNQGLEMSKVFFPLFDDAVGFQARPFNFNYCAS